VTGGESLFGRGEGGEVCKVEVSDLVGGGVEIVGEEVLVVCAVDVSDMGDRGLIPSMLTLADSSDCRNSRPVMISTSTLRSDSSSRNRWFSMRKASRSCSPCRISSSSKTALSTDTSCLDSRSSREEVWFLACRSKSSFWTSISRILS